MKRIAVVAGLALAASCGPTLDLGTAVAAELVSSGWKELQGAGGRNKIVPTVSFYLKNASAQPIDTLQVNAVFRRVNDAEEWSTGFLGTVSRQLGPGNRTDPLTVSGLQGYTGTDPGAALLNNSHFVDAMVELFVKSGSSKWTRVGEFPVARQILSGPPPPR